MAPLTTRQAGNSSTDQGCSGMSRESGINFAHEALHAIVEYLRLVIGIIPNRSAVATLKGIGVDCGESTDTMAKNKNRCTAKPAL